MSQDQEQNVYADGMRAGEKNRPNVPPQHLNDPDKAEWSRGWKFGHFEYIKTTPLYVDLRQGPSSEAGTAKPSSVIESKPLFQ
jgi:hypothetical protein